MSYLLLAALMAGLAADVYRIGFTYIDTFRIFEESSRRGWWGLLVDSDSPAELYRPLAFGMTKAVYEIAGPDLFAYRTVHLAVVAMLMLAMFRICDPRSWSDAWRFAIAVGCAAGLHTSRHLWHGIPLNPYTIVSALALWAIVLARRPPRSWSHVWPPLITVLGLMTIEIGLVVPAILVVGYVVGWRGASGRGVAGTVGLTAVFLTLRLIWLARSGESSYYTETGFGFGVIDAARQREIFGDWPLPFFAYNAAATWLTVLFSEPRNGEFELVERLWSGLDVPPWQWINVFTSLVTTSTIVWAFMSGHLKPKGRQLILVASTGILLNAALSVLYVRDRIPSLAGLLYALCLYASLDALRGRLSSRWPGRVRLAAATVLVALAAGWSARTVATHLSLRDAAWVGRQEWVDRTMRTTPNSSTEEVRAARLFDALRAEALARQVSDPRRDPSWMHHWFERDGSLR